MCAGRSSLNLARCSFIGSEAIVQAVTHLEALTELNLSHLFGLDETSLSAIGKYCKGLKLLNISGCPLLQDASPLASLDRFTSLDAADCQRVECWSALASCSQLTCLNLAGCSPSASRALQYTARSITSLSLARCFIPNDAMREWSCGGLQQLDLASAVVEHQSACECLARAFPSLTALDASSLASSDGEHGAAGIILEHCLPHWQLTELMLSGCKLQDWQLLRASAFMRALGKLSLGTSLLTDASADVIASCSNLTSLSLAGCTRISNDGLALLAHLNLTALDIARCCVWLLVVVAGDAVCLQCGC